MAKTIRVVAEPGIPRSRDRHAKNSRRGTAARVSQPINIGTGISPFTRNCDSLVSEGLLVVWVIVAVLLFLVS